MFTFFPIDIEHRAVMKGVTEDLMSGQLVALFSQCQYNVTGWERSHGLPALSHVWQHLKLSYVSLGTRPRYSLVVDEDVKKPTNQTSKRFSPLCRAVKRRGCEAPSAMAAPVRTNTSESSDSSSTHNFWGGDYECKQTLCLSRRSHIHPKLSTRSRSI